MKCVNLGDIILYEGYETSFEFRTPISNTRYQFELLVIDEEKDSFLIDKKTMLLEPLPQESKNNFFIFKIILIN